MSFLKLFAAGKSMVGLSGTSNRYEATKERILPKFIGRKNPFRGTTLPGGKAPGVPEGRVAAERKVVPAVLKSGGPFAASPAAPVGGRETKGTAAGGRLGGIGDRVRQAWREGWAWVRHKARVARPGGTVGAVPVQRELTLESVRVVRSDLTDCDDEMDALRGSVCGVVRRPVEKTLRESGAVVTLDRAARELFGSQRVER